MYESFYGLKDKPFSMLPDPGFLYLSKKHQAALTLLEYALYNNAGFCVISGDIGAGKTTLLRKLLENMEENVTVGMITNTHQSFGELLDWVLAAFDIHKPGLNKVEMHQVFVDFLMQQYAQDKTALLIVDEAQNMDVDTLEELRMLSNINSEKDQLLQVILAGQPELKQTMRTPALKQFIQRIAVDYHLGPLNLEETFGYIQHRLITAGAKRNVFTPLACQRIYEYSGGIPRLINLLCDTAMVYGFADQVKLIGENLVDEMVRERMADSLVPIIRSVPAAAERASEPPDTSKKNTAPDRAAKQRAVDKPAVKKPAASGHLKQVSSEQKKPASMPSAEKKTAAKTRRAVALSASKSSNQLASLAAEHTSADPVQTSLLQDEPAEAGFNPDSKDIAADNAPGVKIDPEALKPVFDFEAALLAEAEAHGNVEANAESQASQQPEAASKPERAPQHVENHIEVLQPPPVKESKLFDKWTLMALAIMLLVALYLVLPDMDLESRFMSVDSEPAQMVDPEPEIGIEPENALSQDVKLKLEEAEKLKLEMEQMKREEQAMREELEAESKLLQQQRDEAMERAEQEKQARLKKAEEVKRAAAIARALQVKQARLKAEMEAASELARQEAEKKQRAEVEAARKQGMEEEMKRAIEAEAQRARELELEWRDAQRQAVPAAQSPASKPRSEASWKQPDTSTASATNDETGSGAANTDRSKASPEFVLDPCKGPSARFLSTCRK